MVSDGTEFAVGDIERLFEEVRRNTKTKHKKWENYYNRRRRDVQIKVNDWVLVATHPLSSAARKVVAKFKPKYLKVRIETVLDVKNNNVVIWKAGKRLTINVDQARIYRHRKCDETEIGTVSSDNGSLRDESSGFDRVQHRSNELRDGKKKGVLPKYGKKSRREETVVPTRSGYNLRPRKEKREVSRLTMERKTQRGGPVRSRKGRGRNNSPYIEERTRSSNKNARRGGDQQRLNMPRTRQGDPPLAQPASEKFNLIELIPMYDGSELLEIRRFLGKINDVAELGGWSNAEKVTILKLKLVGIAEEFFLSDPTHKGHRLAEGRKRIAEQRPWNSPRFRRSLRDETPVSRSSHIQPVNQRRVRFEDSTPRCFPPVSQGNFRDMGNEGGFRQNRRNENLNFRGESRY
ncbi:uncharacterized protein TNCV_3883081 [Trichonephila clavipes]|nr:uncharacterized protein TNCV_3883081 [Trichonephila clavipes]